MHSGIHVRGVPSGASNAKETASSLQGMSLCSYHFCNSHIGAQYIEVVFYAEYCTKTLDIDVRCMVYVEEDKEMHVAEFDGNISSMSIEVCPALAVAHSINTSKIL